MEQLLLVSLGIWSSANLELLMGWNAEVWRRTDEWMNRRMDRREGGNSGLDYYQLINRYHDDGHEIS